MRSRPLSARRNGRRARAAAAVSSAAMLTWIAAQLRIIGYRSPLQPAVAAAGALVGYLALGNAGSPA